MMDSKGSRIVALAIMAQGYLQNGMFAEAMDAMSAGVVIANLGRAGGDVFTFILPILSDAHRAPGEFTEAVSTAREGVQRGEAGGTRYFEARARIALAAALTQREGPLARAEIESTLAHTEHLVDATEGRSLTPKILEARARLAAKLGDAEASTRLLHDALAVYRDIGATGHAARLAKELDA